MSSDYHVHHHVNVIAPPEFEGALTVVPAEVFPHVLTNSNSEVRMMNNEDGSVTFAYIESTILVDKARQVAAEHPMLTVVLLSHGHDEMYEERTALVLQGDAARFEVTTISTGPVDDVIAEALRDEDFAQGQPTLEK